MMTITVEVPDDLGQSLATLPTDELNRYAVAAFSQLVKLSNSAPATSRPSWDNQAWWESLSTTSQQQEIGQSLTEADTGRTRSAAGVFAKLGGAKI